MDIGTIQQINIDEQMRSAYLDYAMSVIVARALPDARDGLKPVHRRILYAMHDMGIRATGGFKKSARIVGEVLGKYHPHGDSSTYEAMVHLAQPFSMRYPLIEGQGNFGSRDGDSAAAYRYTEAKLSRIAELMLTKKNLHANVDFYSGIIMRALGIPTELFTTMFAIGRSPWKTWIVTLVCMSAAVVNISVFFTGTGVAAAAGGPSTTARQRRPRSGPAKLRTPSCGCRG